MKNGALTWLACMWIFSLVGCEKKKSATPALDKNDPKLQSRGFAPIVNREPEPIPLKKREKFVQLGGAASKALSPEQLDRKPVAGMIEVFVDGKRRRSIAHAALKTAPALVDLIAADLKDSQSIVVQGESDTVWIPRADLAPYALRLNRSGQAKLDWKYDPKNPRTEGLGKGTSKGARPEHSDKVGHEARGVVWIEVLTTD